MSSSKKADGERERERERERETEREATRKEFRPDFKGKNTERRWSFLARSLAVVNE